MRIIHMKYVIQTCKQELRMIKRKNSSNI